MKKVLYLFAFIWITLILVSINKEILSQSNNFRDNPNVDALVLDRTNAPTIDAPFTVVTSEEGYDNFYIGLDFAEPHMSTHPSIPYYIFTAYNNLYNSGLTPHYTINGLDWSSVDPAWTETYMYGDPVTAYDSLGNLYVENMYGDYYNIYGTQIAKSTDNGQTWTSVVDGNSGADKNWIAADQTGGPFANYVYSTMTDLSYSGVNFVRSTDQGSSFVQTANFSVSSALPGSMVCVGPNGDISGGCVYVVTNSGVSYASTYTFHVSTDGGATFTQKSTQTFSNYVGTYYSGRNAVDTMRTRPYPFIAADNSYGAYRGRLYLVYASNNPSGNGNKPDIFCRYSTDQGATWSSAVVINDDLNSQLNHQFFPSIWCDKNTGRLFAKWYDSRLDPTSDSIDVYASYSDDGGITWAQNQRITTKSAKINCKTCGGGGSPRYQGDYDAISSNNNQGVMVWTDFREGTFADYTAYFPDYAMKVSKSADTLNNNDASDVYVSIPSVKLYSNTVNFTAEVNPAPSAGSIDLNFVNGNTISSFPDSTLLRISTSSDVTSGDYIVTIKGEGPGGTPVHTRNISLKLTGITGVDPNSEIASGFSLSQNYPNPFNPVTKINYSLQLKSDVTLKVFDLLGKEVASFSRKNIEAGNHFFVFNGGSLSSGIYFYKLETPYFTDTKRMVLVK